MSIRIGMGVAGFPFSGPAAFLDWVDLCEASPIDSIWFSERLVSPAPTLEPMVAMSLLAGRTQRLKFGMNTIVLPFRDPLVLAKECATLDFLSSGRLLPAFGVGADTAPEFRVMSREPAGRGPQADEMIEIMTRLWSEESVDYEGAHYRYSGASISPRPVQQPLPCWIGGSSPAAIRRTAKLGTGWLAGIQTAEQCAPVISAIKKASQAAGAPSTRTTTGRGLRFASGPGTRWSWSGRPRSSAASPAWPTRGIISPSGTPPRSRRGQRST
jgi:alkanesulfonate monooxygenase SsuD/methylene tetrahydromethanopterin reductase-like flavin-dependent oxidoreductase (luciferase family)